MNTRTPCLSIISTRKCTHLELLTREHDDATPLHDLLWCVPLCCPRPSRLLPDRRYAGPLRRIPPVDTHARSGARCGDRGRTRGLGGGSVPVDGRLWWGPLGRWLRRPARAEGEVDRSRASPWDAHIDAAAGAAGRAGVAGLCEACSRCSRGRCWCRASGVDQARRASRWWSKRPLSAGCRGRRFDTSRVLDIHVAPCSNQVAVSLDSRRTKTSGCYCYFYILLFCFL